MKNFNHQSAQSGHNSILITVILLIAALGIMTIVFNIKLKNSHRIKWQILAAQQASLNALFIAKKMLITNSLSENCFNTSNCPFWGSNHNIRFNNKDGTANKSWWNTNAYNITGSRNNAKFIIIKKPNNLYKIIALAEDLSGSSAIISSGYVFYDN